MHIFAFCADFLHFHLGVHSTHEQLVHVRVELFISPVSGDPKSWSVGANGTLYYEGAENCKVSLTRWHKNKAVLIVRIFNWSDEIAAIFLSYILRSHVLFSNSRPPCTCLIRFLFGILSKYKDLKLIIISYFQVLEFNTDFLQSTNLNSL
jgi:hypothetical protein